MSKTKTYDFNLYSRLLKYLKLYWIAFVIAMIGCIAYSGIDAGVAYFLKPFVNKGLVARDTHFMYFSVPIVITALFVLRGTASFVGDYFTAYVSRGVVMRFRQEIFCRLMRLPAYFFDNTNTGQILSAIIYNVEQVSNASADTLADLVQNVFLVLGLIVVIFSASWRLSLIFLVIIPPLAFIVDKSNRRIRRISRDIQNKMGNVTSIAEEAIQGYKVVRSYGGEEHEINKFNTATNRNRQLDMKTVATKSLTSAVTPLPVGIILILIVYLTSHYKAFYLSPGAFISMGAAMMAMIKPLKRFTSLMASIQRGLAGAQSVFELLDEPIEKDEGAIEIERVIGKVNYENVVFSYPKHEKVVLKNVSFEIKPGQIVALVGHSGGGKSTIASLFPRFYDINEGAIRIDDVDIKKYKLSNLRQQFAIVSQNITLFNDTLRHNIAYGKFSEVTDDEIIQAARMANAWEFIEEMPLKLDTLVGENGVLLSGGQRQRIAIARAILKDAPLLILDEATSALDTKSERLIQAALDKLMKNRTTLVIAHRLSTIEHADKILVVEHGEIVESGSHQELINQNGYYAKLHAMQFRG